MNFSLKEMKGELVVQVREHLVATNAVRDEDKTKKRNLKQLFGQIAIPLSDLVDFSTTEDLAGHAQADSKSKNPSVHKMQGERWFNLLPTYERNFDDEDEEYGVCFPLFPTFPFLLFF